MAPEVTSEVGSSISPRDPELINHITSVQIDVHVSADQSPSKADEKVVTVDSNEEIIVVGRQELQGPISSTLQGYVRRILEQILQSESVQQEPTRTSRDNSQLHSIAQNNERKLSCSGGK